MSHWGDSITKLLNPESKDRRIEVFCQEDQGGWSFVRLTYKDWFKNCKCSGNQFYDVKDFHHHLGAAEARELAAELLKAADMIEGKE